MRPRSLPAGPFLRAQSRVAPARPRVPAVQAPAGPARAATTRGTGAPADLASRGGVARECVAQFLRVLLRQVDLVVRAVEREAHGLVGGEVLVEVVAQDDLDLTSHSAFLAPVH